MMRSLYSGVSGLKTHQTKMDVIGNNIANVNTVAYKSTSVTFQELMYQNTSSASSPNAESGRGGVNAKQIGLGVSMGATNVSITTTGATQTTGNPFDIKITGDSFFIVNDGSSNYFTRAGAFYVDAVGNLAMTSTGYNVMGWQVDDNGEILQNTVSPLKILSAEHMFSQPEATTLGTCSGVLDKADPNLTSKSGKILSLSIYDNLGYEYTAKFSIKPVTTAVSSTKTVETTSVSYTPNSDIKVSPGEDYTYKVAADSTSEGDDLSNFTVPDKILEGLKKYVNDASDPAHLVTDGNFKKGKFQMTKAIANTIAGLAGLTTEQTNEFINKSNIIDKYINVNIEQTTAFKMGDTEVNIKKTTLDALTDLDGSGNGVLYKDTDTSVTPNVDYYRVSTDYQLIVHTKSYEDGSAPDYVYEMVKLADGTRTDVSDKIKALPGTELEMFLGGCKGTKASQYTTTEDVTKEDTVDGQYVVELTELIDIANGKTAMDISVLGDTKRSLVYDTGDGKFKSIGEDGQTAYDLHLSAIGNAGQFKDINIDFSATKNVSNEGTSTIGMKAGDEDGAGAGKLLGALKGVAVDSNGKIYGSYDNGNTELLGQIAVTEFANASGLEKVGENLYQTTLNSGEFDGIGRDISSLSGSMSTGVLEMSNVDLSAEFTDMITTQRGFQANSRIITTSDTLLEELINLKR